MAHARQVATIKDLGLFDNTYFIISSDHGSAETCPVNGTTRATRTDLCPPPCPAPLPVPCTAPFLVACAAAVLVRPPSRCVAAIEPTVRRGGVGGGGTALPRPARTRRQLRVVLAHADALRVVLTHSGEHARTRRVGCRYNLGHHRIPTNKFLLYDHALRIPMVVRGPGVKAGNSSVLGTNVDYAPTFLGMAGIPTPATMDGRSIMAQLVPEANVGQLPAPTRMYCAVLC